MTSVNISTVPDELYVFTPFDPPSTVEAMRGAPRAGHSNDISLIASSEDTYSNDYMYGVAFVPSVVALVFCVWIAGLIMLRCCGASIGCTATSKDPYSSSNNLSRYMSREDQIIQWGKKIFRARLCFLTCGVMAAVAIMVMIADGLAGLNDVTSGFDSNLQILIDLLEEGQFRVNDYLNYVETVVSERDQILSAASTWCPNANDGIIDVNGVTVDYSLTLGNFTEDLNLLGDMLLPATSKVGNNFIDAQDETEEVQTDLEDTASWWFYFVIAFYSIFLLLDAYMIVSVLSSYLSDPNVNPFRNIQTSVALPVFSFMAYLSWFLSASFIFLGILSADMCSDDPELNVVNIITEKELEWGQFLFEQVKFFVQGCSLSPIPEKPTQFYDDFLPALDMASESGFNFLTDVAVVDEENLSISCGADVSSFIDSVVTFQQMLTGTETRTEGMVELLYCSNFNTIYVDMLHNNICNPGVSDVAIISFSLISATVCAMVMITMRLSWNDEGAGKNGIPSDKSEKPSRSPSPGAAVPGTAAVVGGAAISRSASDETEKQNQESNLESEQRPTDPARSSLKKEKLGTFGRFKRKKKKNEDVEEVAPEVDEVNENNLSFDVSVEESTGQDGVETKVL